MLRPNTVAKSARYGRTDTDRSSAGDPAEPRHEPAHAARL